MHFRALELEDQLLLSTFVNVLQLLSYDIELLNLILA